MQPRSESFPARIIRSASNIMPEAATGTLERICPLVKFSSWRRHQNGNIFHVTVHLCGEFTGDRWIPRSKGQWRRALMFSLICARINSWVNNREAGDLRRHRAHYDVIVMIIGCTVSCQSRNLQCREWRKCRFSAYEASCRILKTDVKETSLAHWLEKWIVASTARNHYLNQ